MHDGLHLYPRSGPLSFSYYFICICNDYNAQSSDKIINLHCKILTFVYKWREMLETCTKTLMCKQPRYACLTCSCLKDACLDLLCKRAFKSVTKIPSYFIRSICMYANTWWVFFLNWHDLNDCIEYSHITIWHLGKAWYHPCFIRKLCT